MAVNDNDNAGEKGTPDVQEEDLDSADPDLQPLRLALEAVPDAGTVTLEVPDGIRVWKDDRKSEELTARQWDLSSEQEAFRALASSDLYVEGCRLGRAGEIVLKYKDSHLSFEDRVQVTVVGVDVLRVPDYLFANACYATPIKYQLLGAEDVPVEAVEISLYADGNTPEQFTTNLVLDPVDLTARTMVLNGENANTALAGVAGKGNLLESYLRSTELRTFQFEGSHVTQNARFEVKVTVGRGGSLASVRSNPRDPESLVSEMFGDQAIPAFDLQPGDDHQPILTTMGAQRVLANYRRTELVAWPHLAPQFTSGVEFALYCLNMDGTIPKKITTSYRGINSADWTYDAPYEDAQPENENNEPAGENDEFVNGTSSANPEVMVQTFTREDDGTIEFGGAQDGYPPPAVDPNRRNAFDVCSITSKKMFSAGDEDPTFEFKSKIEMGVTGDDEFKGNYVTKNFGMRIGGYTFVSYGPRDNIPACLLDSDGNPSQIQVPGSQQTIPEQVMDLEKRTGSIHMKVFDGQYLLRTGSEFEGTGLDDAMPWIDGAFATINAIAGASGQVQVLIFTIPAQTLVHVVAKNSSDNTGKAHAKFRGMWAVHNQDGSEKHNNPVEEDPVECINNQNDVGNERTSIYHEKRGLEVGEQFTVWVDLTTQTQLDAIDNDWEWDTDSVMALGKFFPNSVPREGVSPVKWFDHIRVDASASD
ncbi:MAG: hypothetical protein KGZ25_09625 [Planctomycetes bacterium]|nr:hypothetical protein [Planctomycetota bacterium]